MYFLLLANVLVFSPVVVCFLSRLSVVDTIGPTYQASWGTWGRVQYCAQGTYAAGYEMKVRLIMYHCQLIMIVFMHLNCNS
jgi:hypothetical protein